MECEKTCLKRGINREIAFENKELSKLFTEMMSPKNCNKKEELYELKKEAAEAKLIDAIAELFVIINNNDNSKFGDEALDLCPICGSSCHLHQADNGKWYIECGYCPLETKPIFDTEEEAIEYWRNE